ncbi:MAG: exo-alpha-sialidase [Bacteroidetes bacterium]|nr:exo-alpha-sialidase [Bacteroidota bacterium]
MKKGFLLTLCFLACTGLLRSQVQAVPVFVSGTEGYRVFRIPAIIQLADGALLAFAEGRVTGGADFGDIDIVLKKSRDKGRTWSALQKVTDNDTLQSGNPAPVVDLTDPRYPQGRIFLFYNTGNVTENDIRKGKGYKQVWYVTSVDGGSSWSAPVDITLQVHRPYKPAVNPAYDYKEDWRCYANTPGHAEQFQQGTYKGRIYIAANHSAGSPQADAGDYRAHGFYTDDHGESFHLSEVVNLPGSNEASATALPGDRLMLNIRNQKADQRSRIVALSSNGGQRWDTVYFDKQLPDPVCEGSILNLNPRSKKTVLAFSNNASEKRRDSLTLRISFDEGKTWPRYWLVEAGTAGKKGDATAYSDIVSVNKRELGVLYERDNYSMISFRLLRW